MSILSKSVANIANSQKAQRQPLAQEQRKKEKAQSAAQKQREKDDTQPAAAAQDQREDEARTETLADLLANQEVLFLYRETASLRQRGREGTLHAPMWQDEFVKRTSYVVISIRAYSALKCTPP